MSLPETLMSVGVASLLFAAVAAFSLFTLRSFAAMANYADLETESRNALDHMTMDIRQTFGLRSNMVNELDFDDAPDHQTLKFIYDPNAQTLYRWKNGLPNKLLDHCTDLRFDLFQRNTSNATYNQYPITSNAALCKVVQVTWTCKRSLYGSKLLNTEVVQTAKIVIRKK
ncbi:MAG: PilW family protein [Limisphaerales bacterium]